MRAREGEIETERTRGTYIEKGREADIKSDTEMSEIDVCMFFFYF